MEPEDFEDLEEAVADLRADHRELVVSEEAEVDPEEFEDMKEKVLALELGGGGGGAVSPELIERLERAENMSLRNLLKLQYTRIQSEVGEVQAGVTAKDLDDIKDGLEDVISLIEDTPWPAEVQDEAEAMEELARIMLNNTEAGNIDAVTQDISKLTTARTTLSRAIRSWARSVDLPS